MGIHIVDQVSYDNWNGFSNEKLFALCGVLLQNAEGGRWYSRWTEVPINHSPDTICPECRDNPEYAMIMLAGGDLYEACGNNIELFRLGAG